MEFSFYQITGNQITFRVNEEEKELFNQFAISRQTQENKEFTSAKQIILDLLSLVNNQNNSVTNENKTENVELSEENKEVLSIKEQLIESIGYTDIPTEKQLLTDLLDIINTPLEPAPTVEIEKEVIKEVERKLGVNEILVNLSTPQRELLETIARWRLMQKKDSVRLSLEKLIKRMVFNAGTLSNYHGEFETGIPLHKLRTNKGLSNN